MNVVDKHRYKYQKDNNPSFSSTLLDVIYRSIDEDSSGGPVCKKTMRKQQSFKNCLQVEKQNMYHHHHINVGSKSGNVIGSCLETETIYTRPRPIRTSTTTSGMYKSADQQNAAAHNNNNDNVEVVKNKSRAMKIYGYLKRGKQPISPGGTTGRLASFLVSLFTTNNKYVKKSNISSPCTGRHDEVVVIHHHRKNSKSSSVISGSLTPAPRSNGVTGIKKRPVRFYPGNDSQPPFEDSSGVSTMDRCIKERTRNLLKSYENKVDYMFDSITNKEDDDDDDDNDDETGSYASSDLFELDHLAAAIGMDDGTNKCMQELPLYETTSVAANTAIANGFLV